MFMVEVQVVIATLLKFQYEERGLGGHGSAFETWSGCVRSWGLG